MNKSGLAILLMVFYWITNFVMASYVFDTYPGKGCVGHNDELIWDGTFEECMNVCVEDNNCISFEWFEEHLPEEISLCQPSSTCSSEIATTFTTAYGDVILYEKAPLYTHIYDVHPGKGCVGHNDELIWDGTFLECKERCDNDDSCISFEWFEEHLPEQISLCQPSSTCSLDIATTLTTQYGDVVFYEKLGCTLSSSGNDFGEMWNQKGCVGHNDELIWDITINECQYITLRNTNYISFEYFPDHLPEHRSLCQPSSTCSLDITTTLNPDFGDVMFFEKLSCSQIYYYN